MIKGLVCSKCKNNERTYVLVDDFQDGSLGRFCVCLVPLDGDDVLFHGALLGQLDVDVMVLPQTVHHGSATTNDLGVVLGIHAHLDLERLSLKEKANSLFLTF